MEPKPWTMGLNKMEYYFLVYLLGGVMPLSAILAIDHYGPALQEAALAANKSITPITAEAIPSPIKTPKPQTSVTEPPIPATPAILATLPPTATPSPKPTATPFDSSMRPDTHQGAGTFATLLEPTIAKTGDTAYSIIQERTREVILGIMGYSDISEVPDDELAQFRSRVNHTTGVLTNMIVAYTDGQARLLVVGLQNLELPRLNTGWLVDQALSLMDENSKNGSFEKLDIQKILNKLAYFRQSHIGQDGQKIDFANDPTAKQYAIDLLGGKDNEPDMWKLYRRLYPRFISSNTN